MRCYNVGHQNLQIMVRNKAITHYIMTTDHVEPEHTNQAISLAEVIAKSPKSGWNPVIPSELKRPPLRVYFQVPTHPPAMPNHCRSNDHEFLPATMFLPRKFNRKRLDKNRHSWLPGQRAVIYPEFRVCTDSRPLLSNWDQCFQTPSMGSFQTVYTVSFLNPIANPHCSALLTFKPHEKIKNSVTI
jgi:hypothetical protein